MEEFSLSCPIIFSNGVVKESPSVEKVANMVIDERDTAASDDTPANVWEDSKEKVIVTEADITTRLISLEDDPTLPVLTFRTWFLGITLSCFGSVLSQIFYFRPQMLYVSQLFIQVIAYLFGRAMAEFVPGPGNPRPALQLSNRWLWRFLNPGPFNIKEHVAVTIFASTASESALAISIFAADDLFYNVNPPVLFGVFILIASQLIGYGLGGMMRSFLVYPTYIVFPNLIPAVQLFDALHRGKGIFTQKKRVRVFWYTFLGIFLWQWFPEYIAPTLTGISIFCLANQKSAWMTRIFGGAAGNEGLGLLALCLDWNYVGSAGSSLGSLFTPLSTQLSLYAGALICIISYCACYALNIWNAQNLPFLSQALFYENGTVYDQLQILNSKFMLDEAKLAQVGLPWFATSQVLTKIGANLAIGATLTHVVVWYGRDIVNAIKRERRGDAESVDPHRAKMKAYREVPMWWYISTIAISSVMAVFTIRASNSNLPWWGMSIAILFALFLLPFVVTIYAITGYSPDMQSLSMMLAAVLFPGNPQANMYFTLYSFNTIQQARGLIRDLKMGQYTKLPPRVTFMMQSLGAVVGGMLNYVIMRTIVNAQRSVLLEVQGTNVWSGQMVQTFNSYAIAFGALGGELYQPKGRYGIVPLSIPIGLLLPLPSYLLYTYLPTFFPTFHTRFPTLYIALKSINTPILVWAIGYLSAGINSSITLMFLLAIFSQYYLRRYRPNWYRKYNFLVSAALDGGTQVMVFAYTFIFGGGMGVVRPFPNWALNPKGNPDYCKRLT